MKIGVNLKIDVTKIDKTRIFEGEKGKYLDMTAFIDIEQADQYGNNGMITQPVSKEEKQKGIKGPILGNSKVFWKEEGGYRPDTQPQPAAESFDDDDIPF